MVALSILWLGFVGTAVEPEFTGLKETIAWNFVKFEIKALLVLMHAEVFDYFSRRDCNNRKRALNGNALSSKADSSTSQEWLFSVTERDEEGNEVAPPVHEHLKTKGDEPFCLQQAALVAEQMCSAQGLAKEQWGWIPKCIKQMMHFYGSHMHLSDVALRVCADGRNGDFG